MNRSRHLHLQPEGPSKAGGGFEEAASRPEGMRGASTSCTSKLTRPQHRAFISHIPIYPTLPFHPSKSPHAMVFFLGLPHIPYPPPSPRHPAPTAVTPWNAVVLRRGPSRTPWWSAPPRRAASTSSPAAASCTWRSASRICGSDLGTWLGHAVIRAVKGPLREGGLRLLMGTWWDLGWMEWEDEWDFMSMAQSSMVE